jgi:hypothetical protein
MTVSVALCSGVSGGKNGAASAMPVLSGCVVTTGRA